MDHLQKSIEDPNIDRSRKIIISGDLNSIDIDDYVNNPPKSNDIRVFRHPKLKFFSQFLLNDVVKMLHKPVPTHVD